MRLYYDKNDQLLREKEYPALLNAAYDRLRINPSGVRFLYPQTVTPENLAKVKLVAAGSIRHIPAETAGRSRRGLPAAARFICRRRENGPTTAAESSTCPPVSAKL